MNRQPPPATTLNHVAYLTTDTEETVRFYTEILGFRLVAAVREERVPSTGEATPFLHTFFAMQSGECIAFFEIDGQHHGDDSTVPPWVRHLAMNVESPDGIKKWRQRLIDNGVDVVGPIDHEGIWTSIYFFDPNGIRLELTHQSRALDDESAAAAQSLVHLWTTQRSPR